MNYKKLSSKFKELKSLIYEYRDRKRKEKEIKSKRSKLKNEIDSNQKNFERLIDEAADEISDFVKKVNLEKIYLKIFVKKSEIRKKNYIYQKKKNHKDF